MKHKGCFAQPLQGIQLGVYSAKSSTQPATLSSSQFYKKGL
jgi:hypothetical protein